MVSNPGVNVFTSPCEVPHTLVAVEAAGWLSPGSEEGVSRTLESLCGVGQRRRLAWKPDGCLQLPRLKWCEQVRVGAGNGCLPGKQWKGNHSLRWGLTKDAEDSLMETYIGGFFII